MQCGGGVDEGVSPRTVVHRTPVALQSVAPSRLQGTQGCCGAAAQNGHIPISDPFRSLVLHFPQLHFIHEQQQLNGGHVITQQQRVHQNLRNSRITVHEGVDVIEHCKEEARGHGHRGTGRQAGTSHKHAPRKKHVKAKPRPLCRKEVGCVTTHLAPAMPAFHDCQLPSVQSSALVGFALSSSKQPVQIRPSSPPWSRPYARQPLFVSLAPLRIYTHRSPKLGFAEIPATECRKGTRN